MTLKTKRRLAIATIVMGGAISLSGVACAIGFAEKANSVRDDKTKIVISCNYNEINAKLKAEKVLRLTIDWQNKVYTDIEFWVEVNKVKDIDKDKFMEQYASAEKQAQYSALTEKESFYDKLALRLGLGLAGSGAAIAVGTTYAWCDSKAFKEYVKLQQAEREKEL